jgi:hypothetical protein
MLTDKEIETIYRNSEKLLTFQTDLLAEIEDALKCWLHREEVEERLIEESEAKRAIAEVSQIFLDKVSVSKVIYGSPHIRSF